VENNFTKSAHLLVLCIFKVRYLPWVSFDIKMSLKTVILNVALQRKSIKKTYAHDFLVGFGSTPTLNTANIGKPLPVHRKKKDGGRRGDGLDPIPTKRPSTRFSCSTLYQRVLNNCTGPGFLAFV
jgi:hypothetical protein